MAVNNISKGKSPFYPGQPVPIEFFIGRIKEIERISRAIGQVELGKPQAVFLRGEYGIGKSSLAGFMRSFAEKNNNLLGIHVLLGGAETLEDVAMKTVEAAIKSQTYKPTTMDEVREFLSKYVGKQEFFGFSINLEALKADGPTISHGFLPFLQNLLSRVQESGIKGIMLILDEINGVCENPKFAHFIKSLVDENALSQNPLPLLLMLCGVEERRMQMIQNHQPIERIFDIVDIKPMDTNEMADFFTRTFNSVNVQVQGEALNYLCYYSTGFPKIMHIIGDAIFWRDHDEMIDKNDAVEGIRFAAGDIGEKFVEPQVYKALRSEDYRSILSKLAKEDFDLSFKKSAIEKGLNDAEKRKFHNFLQRMKKLNVLKSGDDRGEYIFNNRMVRLYMKLNALHKK